MMFGDKADVAVNPESSKPDSFFGGHSNPRAKAGEDQNEIPRISSAYAFYWSAWSDLRSERQYETGTIPWSALDRYSRKYHADLELLSEIVWGLDSRFLSLVSEKIKNGRTSPSGSNSN
jgi:hypothetical protein